MSHSARAIAEYPGEPGNTAAPVGALSHRVLMLGLGNPLVEDDGVGIFTLDLLRLNYLFEPEVTLIDGGTLGTRLVSVVCQASYLVVLDAYRNGERAGTVSVVPLDTIVGAGRTRTTAHTMGLAAVLMAAELIGSRPPGVLVGIEPASLSEGKWGLSCPVRNALPTLIQTIIGQLNAVGIHAQLAA